jgi:hypothetical protein
MVKVKREIAWPMLIFEEYHRGIWFARFERAEMVVLFGMSRRMRRP